MAIIRFNERRLAVSERPKILYEYYVSGQGTFPVDMLRYDSAWPADVNSVAMIDERIKQARSVQLRSYQEPTLDRWASFVWSVGRQAI